MPNHLAVPAIYATFAAGVVLIGTLSAVGLPTDAEKPLPAAAARTQAQPHSQQPRALAVPRAAGPIAQPCPAVISAASTLPTISTAAVIPGLTAAPTKINPWSSVSEVAGNSAALYRRDKGKLTPIATLPSSLPWEPSKPQPVVVIHHDVRCGINEILTAGRRAVPAPGHPAAAQTAAWVKASDLKSGWATPDRIVIDLSDRTLSIMGPGGKTAHSWPVVVGDPSKTQTPVTTGYILSSYRDTEQKETAGTPIALTSIHSAALASYAGNAGQLGVHYMDPTLAGSGSHGCVRLPTYAAAETVGALPAGTPVIVQR